MKSFELTVGTNRIVRIRAPSPALRTGVVPGLSAEEAQPLVARHPGRLGGRPPARLDRRVLGRLVRQVLPVAGRVEIAQHAQGALPQRTAGAGVLAGLGRIVEADAAKVVVRGVVFEFATIDSQDFASLRLLVHFSLR